MISLRNGCSIFSDPTIPGSNETVTVRLASDVQEFGIGNDFLYSFEIDVIEVI